MVSTNRAVMMTTTGKPRKRPLPRAANQSFATGTVVPLARRKATPRATPNMPSVPMKGGTLSFEISQPFTPPGIRATAMPGRDPATMARNGGMRRTRDVGGMGRDDRRQPHDEADRKVDAARDDDEGLAERQQQGRDREDRDRLRIVAREHEARAVAHARPGLEDDQQQHEEEPRPHAGEPDEPGRRKVRVAIGAKARGRLCGHAPIWLEAEEQAATRRAAACEQRRSQSL